MGEQGRWASENVAFTVPRNLAKRETEWHEVTSRILKSVEKENREGALSRHHRGHRGQIGSRHF